MRRRFRCFRYAGVKAFVGDVHVLVIRPLRAEALTIGLRALLLDRNGKSSCIQNHLIVSQKASRLRLVLRDQAATREGAPVTPPPVTGAVFEIDVAFLVGSLMIAASGGVALAANGAGAW